MHNQDIAEIIAAICGIAIAAGMMHSDFLFYKKNKWDFSKNNSSVDSSNCGGSLITAKTANKIRIFIVYPWVVLFLLALITVAAIDLSH